MSVILHLRIEQLDRQLSPLAQATPTTPASGWVGAIRKALRMPLRSLGARMDMSAEGVKRLELREAEGTITLKVLRKAAEALGMRLVYALVPKQGTLQQLIEDRAMFLAKDIVLRTHQTMKLEGQAVSDERLKAAIQEKAAELRREMPKQLWD